MDTIYALSSGALPSGVAVVRLSGPRAGDILVALGGPLPRPRCCELRTFRDPTGAAAIDRGLAVWFPGPASFTGEDIAEIHVHGGKAVVGAVARSLAGLGARLALPGEFARRAFENGKLDLTEVEGLADLIAAETETQHRQALGSAGGALARRAEDWRSRLIDLRAEIEARLDFSDEADVSEGLPSRFWNAVGELRRELAEAIASASAGERVREGFRVAILGRPNAGKSTLLNALAKRDVAIVTEEAGTTRDVLEVPLNLAGYPVLVSDTAGLREAASEAEREGVRRAEAAAGSADLVLWLQAPGTEAEALPVRSEAPVWRVRTKADLCPAPEPGDLAVSAVTGAGLEELIGRIGALAAEVMGREPALVTRQRQREAIADALRSLDGIDCAAEEVAADLLRSAGDAIGRLSGRIGVEDVLDRLFAEFCIGK